MRARIALRALQTSDAACVGRLLDDLNLQQLVAVFLEVARLARLRFFEGLFPWTLRSRSIICWYRGVGSTSPLFPLWPLPFLPGLFPWALSTCSDICWYWGGRPASSQRTMRTRPSSAASCMARHTLPSPRRPNHCPTQTPWTRDRRGARDVGRIVGVRPRGPSVQLRGSIPLPPPRGL